MTIKFHLYSSLLRWNKAHRNTRLGDSNIISWNQNPHSNALNPYIIPSTLRSTCFSFKKQESPAIADKPARRESLSKLLQFDVPTTLSLTILAYLHAFNCYCVRNPQNPEEFTENSNLWSSRSSNVIDLGANRKPICDLLLVTNSNFSRICCRFRDIHG